LRIKSILNFIYTALIIITVFSVTITALQEPFLNQTATFKFLFWQTEEFPMIMFIMSAFVIVLFTGLVVAVIDNFHSRKELKEYKKRLEALLPGSSDLPKIAKLWKKRDKDL
jgi:uncharacterized integral membrane protein